MLNFMLSDLMQIDICIEFYGSADIEFYGSVV